MADASTIVLGIEMFIELEEEYVSDKSDSDTVFKMVEPGSFVGLRSQVNNLFQIFFVAKVYKKDNALEDFIHTNGYLNLKDDYSTKHVK